MPRLKLHLSGKARDIAFEGRPLLSELLRREGLRLSTPCGGKGICGKCGALVKLAGEAEPRRLLACRTRLEGSAELWLPEAETIEQIELNHGLQALSGPAMQGRYGLALDIGSTTLAARLVDLKEGRPLAAAACANPQRELSDNVIGRIEAALAGQGPELRRMVKEAAEGLLQEACRKAGVGPEEVDRRVICGNTTMLTLHEGRDPAALARAPFRADWLAGEWDAAGRVHLAPCIEALTTITPISVVTGIAMTKPIEATNVRTTSSASSPVVRNFSIE